MTEFIGVVFIVLIAIAIIGLGPILTIASLNTLFGLNIAYTFSTWLSVVWMNMTTFGGLSWAIRNSKKG